MLPPLVLTIARGLSSILMHLVISAREISSQASSKGFGYCSKFDVSASEAPTFLFDNSELLVDALRQKRHYPRKSVL